MWVPAGLRNTWAVKWRQCEELLFLIPGRNDILGAISMKCDEAPEEPPTVSREKILKLQCNISGSTNYMHTGIMEVRCSACLLRTQKMSPWTEFGPEDYEEFPLFES